MINIREKSFVRVSVLFLFLFVLGCQEYTYERLPSSVIKEKRFSQTIGLSHAIDILFVIDNSNSMMGEQIALAESFGSFVEKLEENFGDEYHIAVVTTGWKISDTVCPSCSADITYSCVNKTGESGSFQYYVGQIKKEQGNLVHEWINTTQTSCKLITKENLLDCPLYNVEGEGEEKIYTGTALVGVKGCAWEKGLAAMKRALEQTRQNGDFLRSNATLAIVIVTDENDCGELYDLDVNGKYTGGGYISANACAYAAHGAGPTGDTTYNDSEGKETPYKLTPIEYYRDFLVELKGGRADLVKFAGIVGVKSHYKKEKNSRGEIELSIDKIFPEDTKISFLNNTEVNANELNICISTKFLEDFVKDHEEIDDPNDVPNNREYDTEIHDANKAYPGTRYIEMASLFGENGFIDSICRKSFEDTMSKLGTFVACPRYFKLTDKILDPSLANILINDKPVPRLSCGKDEFDEDLELIECQVENDDPICPQGTKCRKTWYYYKPEDLTPEQKEEYGIENPLDEVPGGIIVFANHYDPCELYKPDPSDPNALAAKVQIELVYVTE